MYCMRCGRDILPEETFCRECIAEMRKYPVSRDVVVRLPQRSAPPRKAPVKKRAVQTDPQRIQTLQRRIRRLWAALIVSVLTAAALGYYTVNDLMTVQKPRPGQNYSTVTVPPSEASEPSGTAAP